MATVSESRMINAPIAAVWQSWDDFGNIYQFNPNLKGSHIIGQSAPTGLGAARQCDLRDGKNHIRERIIGYEPERKLVVDIYAGTLPMKSAIVTFTFREERPGRIEVTMTMDFTPKYGFIGALMVPMMKPQLRKMMQSLLGGNADYVERGKTIAMAA